MPDPFVPDFCFLPWGSHVQVRGQLNPHIQLFPQPLQTFSGFGWAPQRHNPPWKVGQGLSCLQTTPYLECSLPDIRSFLTAFWSLFKCSLLREVFFTLLFKLHPPASTSLLSLSPALFLSTTYSHTIYSTYSLFHVVICCLSSLTEM